jgi:hypothetical protein
MRSHAGSTDRQGCCCIACFQLAQAPKQTVAGLHPDAKSFNSVKTEWMFVFTELHSVKAEWMFAFTECRTVKTEFKDFVTGWGTALRNGVAVVAEAKQSVPSCRGNAFSSPAGGRQFSRTAELHGEAARRVSHKDVATVRWDEGGLLHLEQVRSVRGADG